MLLLLACGAGACAGEPVRGPFTANGEVIAFGGGDGGPKHACFSCHGLSGEGDGQASPRLAGLPSGYMQRQLADYAEGRRTHPLMSPIGRTLSFEDRQAVSDYYERLPVDPRPPGETDLRGQALFHQGDPARGLAPCASCHGSLGQGVGLAYPPLAGQPAIYLAEQLRQWRNAKRRNDPMGVMLAVSRRLSEDEAEAVSRYAAGLPAPSAPPSATLEASP